MIIDAYIPARGGSKRVKNKNIRDLCGHPLLAYTIAAALQSDIFRRVIVSSNDHETLKIAEKYGAESVLRSNEASSDNSVDFDGLNELFDPMEKRPDNFCVLYPTAPFRSAELIKRAWRYFQNEPYATGLISVVEGTPLEKKWIFNGKYLEPAIQMPPINGHEVYNCPSQILGKAYDQRAAIKIGDIRSVVVRRDLWGRNILPFWGNEYELFDINTQEQFDRAVWWAETGRVTLPQI